MDENKKTREISLKDLGMIFIKRFWILLIVSVVAVLGAFGFLKITYKPMYKSVATLYVLSAEDENKGTTTNDFMLAFHLVKDCEYIIKSPSVLDDVIEQLDLPDGEGGFNSLRNSIEVTNPKETRIIEVSIKNKDPEMAQKIADAVCVKASTVISKVMGENKVNVFEKGQIPSAPCNKTGIGTYILIGVIAAVITYAIFLIMYVLDDKLRTDDDIMNLLGLSVLGNIPDINEVAKMKKGYKKYCKTYGENVPYGVTGEEIKNQEGNKQK